MSMQYLLLEKEKKMLKKMRAFQNDSGKQVHSNSSEGENYDDPQHVDIENEPEIKRNISTSLFIKEMVEKLENSTTEFSPQRFSMFPKQKPSEPI